MSTGIGSKSTRREVDRIVAEGSTATRRGGITWRWLIIFCLGLYALTWLLIWSESTRKVDRLLHDIWVRSEQRQAPDDVVIAAIDAKSLQSIGRWPWPREVQAKLVDKLAASGARALVNDVLYMEPSARRSTDEALAEAFERIPVTILPLLVENRGGLRVDEQLPIPALARVVDDIGQIVLPIDDDGIVRRVYLKGGFRHAHWSTLALAARDALQGGSAAELPGRRLSGEAAIRSASDDATRELGHTWVNDHEVYVPFYGPSGTFRRISVIDILDGNESAMRALQGRIVFFGLTSTGLGDVVPTPVSALDHPMPGVEIHANIFAALRDGSLVTAVNPWINLWLALGILPLMLIGYSRMPPHWNLVTTAVATIAPALASMLLYRYARLWYPPLGLSVPMLVSYLFWSRHQLGFITHFLEGQQRRLQPILPREQRGEVEELTNFFEHAIRHLPLKGWRFTWQGDVFSGGEGLPERPRRGDVDRWIVRDGIGARSWGRAGQLNIELAYKDVQNAREINRYVDSLARVRWNKTLTPLSGSIERLEISARKFGEQVAWLESIKEFSETVLAGTPVGIIIWNPAGECVRHNPLAETLIPSLARDSLLADLLDAVGRPLDDPANRARLDRLVLEARLWQIPASIGDRELVVSLSAVGNTLHQRLICASIDDVTEIRTVERARGEMIEYLSHDLRSPLISALYQLERIRERLEENETALPAELPMAVGFDSAGIDFDLSTEAQAPSSNGNGVEIARVVASLQSDEFERVAGSIENNIQASLTMMEDLLHVARADALSQQQFSELLLNNLVDNAIDQLMPQALKKGIELEVDTPDEGLWVMGEVSSLQRALINVIGNAIKYSHEGGRVWVKLALVRPRAGRARGAHP
ncbi:MAG: hypothetical protein CSB44_01445 [Gammaproteobacteria bacterium]|nr:MAG: hypothetical protein CSB44_01445 [Gammaproteobacteria bacterium]